MSSSMVLSRFHILYNQIHLVPPNEFDFCTLIHNINVTPLRVNNSQANDEKSFSTILAKLYVISSANFKIIIKKLYYALISHISI